mmetsp:Transcript_65392/g.156367  ORF Transcript_65392/g.156367 Transcript_65392/m.156367 type:complete len:209 (-) Transcript_65392:317-943(-)
MARVLLSNSQTLQSMSVRFRKSKAFVAACGICCRSIRTLMSCFDRGAVLEVPSSPCPAEPVLPMRSVLPLLEGAALLCSVPALTPISFSSAFTVPGKASHLQLFFKPAMRRRAQEPQGRGPPAASPVSTVRNKTGHKFMAPGISNTCANDCRALARALGSPGSCREALRALTLLHFSSAVSKAELRSKACRNVKCQVSPVLLSGSWTM